MSIINSSASPRCRRQWLRRRTRSGWCRLVGLDALDIVEDTKILARMLLPQMPEIAASSLARRRKHGVSTPSK